MMCPGCQQDNPLHANFCLAGDVPLRRTRESDPREILRVVAGSGATDVTPVFDAILQSALALCDAPHGVVLRLEGDGILRLAPFKGS